MESIFITILALSALFYILGKSADLAIHNLRAIAEKLGIRIFFLGLIMGFFTSFPELAVGISAVIDNVSNISLGNLFGGIIVLFGLILGTNVILQRQIKSEQSVSQFGIIMLFLFFPVVLGLDGRLGLIDGLLIIIGYFTLLLVMYFYQKRQHIQMPHLVNRDGLVKNVFLFILGMVLVMLVAKFTIDLTVDIISQFNLSKFVFGILVFSIGTNFPEIIVALRSWKNKVGELSVSNLLGSGMSNMLIVGVFAVMRPFRFVVNESYYILLAALAVLLIMVFWFYRSDGALKRREGMALVLVYVAFIILQLVFEGIL